MTDNMRVVVVSQRFFNESTITYLEENDCEVRIADLPAGQADGGLSECELVELLSDADGWIVGHANVTSSLLSSLPKLKVISRRGVGYDRVDTGAVKASGKVATIAVDCNDSCVADHAIGMMLSLGHKLRESQQQMINGDWSIKLGTDLYMKTVGLVGLGRISRAMVRRLIGFEANILVCTPTHDFQYGKDNGLRYTDLEELLQKSDYVSLHAPLTPQTKSLINAKTLRQMKPSAFLINTARGGLVDDSALLSALKNNEIAGAGLDVYQSESDKSLQATTEELISLPNVIAAPHSGASTVEGLNRTNMAAAQCVVAVLNGESPPEKYIIADGRS